VTSARRAHATVRPLIAVVVCVVVLVTARPARAEPFGWPQPDGPGTAVVLSYSFVSLFAWNFLSVSELQLRAATADAFRVWSTHAPLHFVERYDAGPAPTDHDYPPGDLPDIRIGAHGEIDRLILAHAFPPVATDVSGLAGDIHFNSDSLLEWGITEGFPRIDLLEVLVHEIGHALGLMHIFDVDAIMNPPHGFRFQGAQPAFLLPADIAAVQAIYGAGTGSVQPIPEPSTLVLVGAGALVGVFRRSVASAARRRRID
jgi:hypothetical protein